MSVSQLVRQSVSQLVSQQYQPHDVCLIILNPRHIKGCGSVILLYGSVSHLHFFHEQPMGLGLLVGHDALLSLHFQLERNTAVQHRMLVMK